MGGEKTLSITMERTLMEAALQEKRRKEIDALKEQRKERSKMASGFSGKQKKQQLRARKQRLANRKQDELQLDELQHQEYRAFYDQQVNEENFHEEPDFFAREDMDVRARLKLTVALGKNNKDAVGKELSSFFVKETKEQIHLRLMEGQQPLDLSKRLQPLRAQEIVDDRLLDHPKRPKWHYGMSKQKVDEQESLMFDRWLTAIHDKYEPEHLNHFEHNLEVWRELWRVTERATHIVVVADIRNPLLHIPPSIYEHVTQELQKPMTVVLNKIDLVAPRVVALWQTYLQKRFPKCSFVCFSSRSNAVRDTKDVSTRRRVLTKKLEVGDASAMNGAARILTACGVEASEAKEIVNELNANWSEVDLLDAMMQQKAGQVSTKKKSRRSKHKSHKRKDEEEEHPLCQHCGCEDAVVACLTCHNGPAAVQTEAEAIAAGYLLCRRCEFEEHEHLGSSKHQLFPLTAAAAELANASVEPPTLTIGLIGHPNVGKSSVLNALAGKKIVSVSHTPGHTKRLQSILITPQICICDCPGLVFPFANVPKYLQELCGLYPYSQIREPYSAVRFLSEHVALEGILDLKPRTQHFDGVDEPLDWTPWSLCEAYAEKRGYRTDRRGRPDHQRAGAELIRDTVDGILPLCFLPPDYEGDQVAVVVPKQPADQDDDDVDGEGQEEGEVEAEDDCEVSNATKPTKLNAFSLLDDDSSSDEEYCN